MTTSHSDMLGPETAESLPGARRIASLLMVVCWSIGGICLVYGAACFRSVWLERRVLAERTAFPLNLEAGATARGQLNASARFPLELWLVARRPAGVTDQQLHDTLLGTNASPSVRWKIQEGDVTVASGDSAALAPRSYSSRESSGRFIGQFGPKSPGSYEFQATVIGDLQRLAAALPEIEARASLPRLMNANVRVVTGKWFGAISVLIGGLLMVLSWRERRKIRRDLESKS